ncbi:hypothetical protein [Nonomuraea pusilla]|uniref:Uncharacterized protein n=1 Tax=Nonomuraea pusilla TaxID=46177 RepID=A0A1H8K5X7_9ACTN|nr:hypothetical protein [Nonomuraea pusilla]SEN88449.1 hypothetical protein SAMN05660976_08536 [Nonomuraea pusilla]
MSRPPLPELHPEAVAVSAFRGLPDGTGRQYTISEAPSKREAIKASIHRAKAIGFIQATTHREADSGPCDCYAVLDILDANDEIVQDFCIPTARAFQWWYRHLDLRIAE